MTEIALPWANVPDDLPVVMIAGNPDRELRKKALRAGSEEALKLGYRQFQSGGADPVQYHASVVDVPGGGEFILYDAGRVWDAEMSGPNYRKHVAILADACSRASCLLFDRVDSIEQTQSVAGMAAAYRVPRAAIWVDEFPREPSPDDRAQTASKLAADYFAKPKLCRGDLKAISECQCGESSCETCGPWLELVAHATQERPVPTVDFRILVTEVTGWGVTPHARIVRGVQRGEIDVGDEIEVRSGAERHITTVDDIARGGIVFTLKALKSDEIDAIAKPGSLEARDVVAARAMGEATGTTGQAFIEGSHVGRVSVGTVGKKRILRFKRPVPFRRGDVVSVFYREDESAPFLADSYVILDD